MELEKKSQFKLDYVEENCIRNAEHGIIEKVSELLQDICDENKNDTNIFYKPLECFYSRRIPLVSIQEYIEYIYKYTKINSSTIILMLIYIDRICNMNKFKISYYNIQKLILASMILAIKYNEDEIYSLKVYAEIGGVTKAELEFLEICFISFINFNLFIKEELFNKYYDYFAEEESDYDDDEEEELEKEERKGRIQKEKKEDSKEKQKIDDRKQKG